MRRPVTRTFDAEHGKQLVRALVEAVNARDAQRLGQIASGEFARTAHRWVRPFGAAFPDFRMEVVDVIAEDDRVVAHVRCSGTHEGDWLGLAPTGRRFQGVDEIFIFAVRDGLLASAVTVEDNLSRLRQLGIGLSPGRAGPRPR